MLGVWRGTDRAAYRVSRITLMYVGNLLFYYSQAILQANAPPPKKIDSSSSNVSLTSRSSFGSFYSHNTLGHASVEGVVLGDLLKTPIHELTGLAKECRLTQLDIAERDRIGNNVKPLESEIDVLDSEIKCLGDCLRKVEDKTATYTSMMADESKLCEELGSELKGLKAGVDDRKIAVLEKRCANSKRTMLCLRENVRGHSPTEAAATRAPLQSGVLAHEQPVTVIPQPMVKLETLKGERGKLRERVAQMERDERRRERDGRQIQVNMRKIAFAMFTKERDLFRKNAAATFTYDAVIHLGSYKQAHTHKCLVMDLLFQSDNDENRRKEKKITRHHVPLEMFAWHKAIKEFEKRYAHDLFEDIHACRSMETFLQSLADKMHTSINESRRTKIQRCDARSEFEKIEVAEPLHAVHQALLATVNDCVDESVSAPGVPMSARTPVQNFLKGKWLSWNPAKGNFDNPDDIKRVWDLLDKEFQRLRDLQQFYYSQCEEACKGDNKEHDQWDFVIIDYSSVDSGFSDYTHQQLEALNQSRDTHGDISLHCSGTIQRHFTIHTRFNERRESAGVIWYSTFDLISSILRSGKDDKAKKAVFVNAGDWVRSALVPTFGLCTLAR